MNEKGDYLGLAKKLEMLLEKIEKYELEENELKFDQIKEEILELQERL